MTSSLNVCWIILIDTDKCSLYTSSQKLLFARVTDNTKKPQLVKIHRTTDPIVPRFSTYIYTTTQAP